MWALPVGSVSEPPLESWCGHEMEPVHVSMQNQKIEQRGKIGFQLLFFSVISLQMFLLVS